MHNYVVYIMYNVHVCLSITCIHLRLNSASSSSTYIRRISLWLHPDLYNVLNIVIRISGTLYTQHKRTVTGHCYIHVLSVTMFMYSLWRYLCILCAIFMHFFVTILIYSLSQYSCTFCDNIHIFFVTTYY